MTHRPMQTIEEAAAKVAATWPALTEAQKDKLSRIFAPIIRAENAARESASPSGQRP